MLSLKLNLGIGGLIGIAAPPPTPNFDFFARDVGSLTLQEKVAGNNAAVVGGNIAMLNGTVTTDFDINGLTDIELSIWFKSDWDGSTNVDIFSSISGYLLCELSSDGRIYLRANDGGAKRTRSSYVNDGGWHYYTFRILNGVMSIEVDNVEITSDNVSFSSFPVTNLLTIGGTQSGNNLGYSADINNERLYHFNNHLYDSITWSKAVASGGFDFVLDNVSEIMSTKKALDNGYIALDSGENIINEDDSESVFDNGFINAIDYADAERNSQAEWSFKYSGTEMKIKANPVLYPSVSAYSQISIIINDVYYTTVNPINTEFIKITLPTGDKHIRLIEGLLSGKKGTFITDIHLDNSKFNKIQEANVSEKLIFIGDSITVGANSEIPAIQSFPRLFDYEDSKSVAVLGWGGARVRDFGETQGDIDEVIGHITDLISNVTSDKKVIIALGTNDFAAGYSDANVTTWYENLLNAINALDSEIQIYCVSPLLRSDDAALLDDYRNSIELLCDTRAYSSYIEGKTILELTDLADGVHPTASGHSKYKQSIENIIL